MDCKAHAPLVMEHDPTSLPRSQGYTHVQKALSTGTQASESSLLENLERKLGYFFTDKALLRAALQHRSWIYEVRFYTPFPSSHVYTACATQPPRPVN
jgi:hypothetical protein